MLDKKNSYEGLYVYHQKDIQMIKMCIRDRFQAISLKNGMA